MAAIELTEVTRNEPHVNLLMCKAMVTTAGDWVVFDGFKGVIPLKGMAQSILTSGAETPKWGVARIDNAGVAYTATSTSIVCDECTITRTGKFYLITASGEIMEVLTDATPGTAVGTFTVRRGCFGTTPSLTGLADNNYMGIMNIVFLGRNLVGPHLFVVYPMPNDPFQTNADGGAR